MERHTVDDQRSRSVPQLASAALQSGLGLVASAVLGFAFTVAIARALPTATAGALFEALAVFVIVSTIAQLGASSGVLWMIPILRAEHRESGILEIVKAAVIPVFLVGSLFGAGLFAGFGHFCGPLSSFRPLPIQREDRRPGKRCL